MNARGMKLHMVSLGCDKNLVDSERMLGILSARGFVLTDEEAEAEVAVVNTCCFIDDAKKESIDRIFELARLKETGKLKVLIAAGCMAERYQDEILEEIPELDAIVGTTGIAGIAQAVESALAGTKGRFFRDISSDPSLPENTRVVTTGGHYAYLKIAEGCDKHCTYCAIPSFRGHYRSFPMESLIKEAETLAEGGVRELIIVAQETTVYGVDLYGKKMLHELLKKLCRIDGLHWIPVLYCYPEEIYPELIDVMAQEEKICHYLDLPIQHAADSVLKRMNRRTDENDLRELVTHLRSRIPDIVLRTTLITGFPGETEEEHETLMSFIRDMQFDRLGVFPYSKEEGTVAATMKPQVPERVKLRRQDEIMQLQQTIAFEKEREQIGRDLPVLVTGYDPDSNAYICRSYMDAPDIDSVVYVSAGKHHNKMSGDMIRCHVTDTDGYDLIAEII